MIELIDNLNLDNNLKDKAKDLARKDKVNVLMCAKSCNEGNFDVLQGKDDLFILVVLIECMSKTLEKYKSLGIDEKVFYDTFDDIRIWCENNSNKGIKNYNWIKNHIMCQLFKIGRLQFQFYVCNNDTLNFELLPFEYGDNLIYIHIPQGEKLEYSECVKSLQEAIRFFNRYFPEYKYDFFFCESWLLYEDNWLFMERSSNILEFSTLFDVMYNVEDDSQAIERIFGKRRRLVSMYPEKTTLQKNAKSHLRNKGRLGLGIGLIEKQCFE